MSIAVMKAVWDYSLAEGTALVVLLALADNANDEGECWPAIASIARKARLSERQTQRLLQQLEDDEEITVVPAVGRGHSNRYRLRVAEMVTAVTPISSKNGDIHDTNSQEKVTSRARKGDIAMSPEPSIEPSNNNAPRGLSDLFDAFRDAGLPDPILVKGEARYAKELRGAFGAKAVAECWADVASKRWGWQWLWDNLSFEALSTRMQNWKRWRDEGRPARTPAQEVADYGGKRYRIHAGGG